jgi:26S proteasome regulatory subunit N8
MVTGLRGLRSRLLEVREYLEVVSQGRLPVNHDILRNLQARPAGGWGRGGGKTG